MPRADAAEVEALAKRMWAAYVREVSWVGFSTWRMMDDADSRKIGFRAVARMVLREKTKKGKAMKPLRRCKHGVYIGIVPVNPVAQRTCAACEKAKVKR